MSIASQITRIQQDRNTIRNKLVELGLANYTDKLNDLATAIEGISDNGDVTDTIDGLTTVSVTIPSGYTTGGTITLTDDIEAALAAV